MSSANVGIITVPSFLSGLDDPEQRIVCMEWNLCNRAVGIER